MFQPSVSLYKSLGSKDRQIVDNHIARLSDVYLDQSGGMETSVERIMEWQELYSTPDMVEKLRRGTAQKGS